jgi:lipid A 3-O-deacylase
MPVVEDVVAQKYRVDLNLYIAGVRRYVLSLERLHSNAALLGYANAALVPASRKRKSESTQVRLYILFVIAAFLAVLPGAGHTAEDSLGQRDQRAPLEDAYSVSSSLREKLKPERVFVQFGSASGVKTVAIGAIWSVPSLRRALGSSELSMYTEALLGNWWVDGSEQPNRTNTQFGLTPVLRLSTPYSRGVFFYEAGIGLNFITPVFNSPARRFSTVFNFGDHLGVGWRPAALSGWEIALRFQHFSNAGIKKPNPGQNFFQLRLSVDY